MNATMTAIARHVPLLLASVVALFLVAPLAIILPMSFSKAVSFEFPPPGYWTGYYAQYFASHSWLEATANSFIIAFGSMVFTLVAALPAAFGFVRYRFRGSEAMESPRWSPRGRFVRAAGPAPNRRQGSRRILPA